MHTKTITNPFSPDYVSQVKPFKEPSYRRPEIKKLPPLDRISTDTPEDHMHKHMRLAKATI